MDDGKDEQRQVEILMTLSDLQYQRPPGDSRSLDMPTQDSHLGLIT
jgi:hypothetical protein